LIQQWSFLFPEKYLRTGAAMSKPILIVEDDEIALVGLASVLQSHGFGTVTSANGNEALARLQSGLQPGLILLHMILPECDGWHFCARLKDTQGIAVPFAIMTGLGIASEEWAEAMGAVELLRKPLDIEHLLALVRRYVQRDGAARLAAGAEPSANGGPVRPTSRQARAQRFSGRCCRNDCSARYGG
jgi:CheY-like chemotaxis protein